MNSFLQTRQTLTQRNKNKKRKKKKNRKKGNNQVDEPTIKRVCPGDGE